MLMVITCPNCGTRVPYNEVVEEGGYTVYIYKCPKCGHVVKRKVRKGFPSPWKIYKVISTLPSDLRSRYLDKFRRVFGGG